jgi:hypothetical protein
MQLLYDLDVRRGSLYLELILETASAALVRTKDSQVRISLSMIILELLLQLIQKVLIKSNPKQLISYHPNQLILICVK